ncbi:MAG: glycerate kinase [Nitrospirae bacterium]|nr:MAG: glycerate kinase [Nitrospirota bacterium]
MRSATRQSPLPWTVNRLLDRLIRAALAAADPKLAVRRTVKRSGPVVHVDGRSYDLRAYDRVVAVGAGKASAQMAVALERCLGGRLEGGLVVVKNGYAAGTKTIRVLEAGHPVPNRAGQQSAARLMALVHNCSDRDLVFVLLSGGASSLLPAPAAGLTLADLQRTTSLLLACGASIQDINTVRKHLSALQGGRLAAATKARVVSLILSDVPGDDLGAIGSGPTAPDATTYEDASEILRRHEIWRSIPAKVRTHLLAGCRGDRNETPKPGAPLFRRVQNRIIGNNAGAVHAAAQAARQAGLNPLILTTRLVGEAKEAAKLFGAIAKEIAATGRPIRRPACVIAGGELTVTRKGTGRGGRAQEFSLAAAMEIAGLPNVWIAAFGTDGTDGPTDAAGACANGFTAARATRLGVDPATMLARNDSYGFFKKIGGHLRTGPTGTNVNDLYLLLAL